MAMHRSIRDEAIMRLWPSVCCSNCDAMDEADNLDSPMNRKHMMQMHDEVPIPSIPFDADPDSLRDYPEVQLGGGATYAGQWLGRTRHGQGVLTTILGERYEGSFAHDQPHGEGLFSMADGTTYRGQWEQGRRHGYGKYLQMDGISYEGGWKHDHKSGLGVEYYPGDARYEGDFSEGFKHGIGKYTSGMGATYEGQFKQDMMDGEGLYKFADGRKYFGQWRQGHMNGAGKMEWPDGSKHEGHYEKDVRHGPGVYMWTDGRLYRGHWRNGRLDGPGIMVDINGVETPCDSMPKSPGAAAARGAVPRALSMSQSSMSSAGSHR